MPLRPTPQIARIYLLVAALLLALPGLCSLYSRYEGKVLVALPRADDQPYFARTVVYIGSHDGWGAVGVILNRPLSDEHREMLKNTPPGFDWRFGGPVDADHTRFVLIRDKDAPETLEDKHAYKLISLHEYTQKYPEEWEAVQADPEKKQKFTIFAGYSGWRPNQLEREIYIKGWGITDFSADMLYTSESSLDLWTRILKTVVEERPPKDGRI